MATRTLLRPRVSAPSSCCHNPQTQTRNATLLARPHRPYTFTQLVTLSDGSTYTCRTTSPRPIFRSTKDTRNHPMWQPSLDSLRNVEQDEAGRLRAFRQRFGRGWDLDGDVEEVKADGKDEGVKNDAKKGSEEEDEGGSLMDLISGGAYGGKGTAVTQENKLPTTKHSKAKK